MDKFIFYKIKKLSFKQKQLLLEFLKNIDATLIIYEAPHRINKTLTDMGNILGNNRKISISREITDVFSLAQRKENVNPRNAPLPVDRENLFCYNVKNHFRRNSCGI